MLTVCSHADYNQIPQRGHHCSQQEVLTSTRYEYSFESILHGGYAMVRVEACNPLAI